MSRRPQASETLFLGAFGPFQTSRSVSCSTVHVLACSAAHFSTGCYAEKEHFEKGTVAVSGGSKNGASPSVSILHDKRMTALHSTVAPIWDSPLRLSAR